MTDSTFFDRIRLKHRAGDNWHPLVEVSRPATAPNETAEPTGRVYRCDECDLEIIAVGEFWQEGTMDW